MRVGKPTWPSGPRRDYRPPEDSTGPGRFRANSSHPEKAGGWGGGLGGGLGHVIDASRILRFPAFSGRGFGWAPHCSSPREHGRGATSAPEGGTADAPAIISTPWLVEAFESAAATGRRIESCSVVSRPNRGKVPVSSWVVFNRMRITRRLPRIQKAAHYT